MGDLIRLAELRELAATRDAQRHAAALCVAVLAGDPDAEAELIIGGTPDQLAALALALARLATGSAVVSFAGHPSPIATARELFVRVAIQNQDE